MPLLRRAFLLLIVFSAACAEHVARPALDLRTETLYTVEHSTGTGMLTTEQRRTALLIQKSHYQNMNRMLAELKVSGRDKKRPDKAVFCALSSEFRLEDHPDLRERFFEGHPILKAQPVVFNEIQLSILRRLTECEEHMFFTQESARDLDEQFSALFLENSGTPYCVVDDDCTAFMSYRVRGGVQEEAPIVSSRLTDPVFTITLRKFRPALLNRLQQDAAAERDIHGQKHPDAGKLPSRPLSYSGPEPKAACRENLCRLEAP